VGTRRYSPDLSAADVQTALEAMGKQGEAATRATVDAKLVRVGDGFRLREDNPLVVLLQRAYATVTGEELSFAGVQTVGDASIFMRDGQVPTVYRGPGGEGVHTDLEWMPVAEVVRAVKVCPRRWSISEGNWARTPRF